MLSLSYRTILVPQTGIEPRPPALGVQILSHWTTRKSQSLHFEKGLYILFLYDVKSFPCAFGILWGVLFLYISDPPNCNVYLISST